MLELYNALKFITTAAFDIFFWIANIVIIIYIPQRVRLGHHALDFTDIENFIALNV